MEEEIREAKIFNACIKLPPHDIKLLADAWDLEEKLTKEEICREIAKDLKKIKKELRISWIILKLLNEAID